MAQNKTVSRYTFCLITVLLIWALPNELCARQAPDDTLSYQTEHLEFRVVPDRGQIKINLPLDDTARKPLTSIDKVLLDDVPQQDFRVKEVESGLQLVNDHLTVDFERLDNRSLAVSWSTNDQKLHDFDIKMAAGSHDESEAFYGTGERFNAINQKGYMIPMASQDNYGPKGVVSYKPVAFYMSSLGYGVWIDSYAQGLVDFGGMDKDYTRLSYRDKSLRLVFFGGPDLGSVLDAYTDQTGKSPVPPRWAFGLWKGRDVHQNEDSVYVDITKMRKYDLPSSVLIIDSPWETAYNNFEVNKQQFIDPDQMFKRIRQAGFVPCLWLTPFINSKNVKDMRGVADSTALFGEAAQKGYLIHNKAGDVLRREWWKGEGGLIDFTNPDAEEWWHQQLLKTRKYGVRAFKFDDGEGNFVPEADFTDGTDSYKMSNKYALLYHRSGYRYIKKYLDGDGVLMARTGFSGSQQYPMSWAGDNHADFSTSDGLRSVIVAGQNAALSGLSFWGSDIAGYAGTADKTTYIRWAQFSTFTPLMEILSSANLSPWDFDQQTLDIFRKYAQLRMRLFPYLYQMAHVTSETGMPVIRPMALAFQDDSKAQKHIYQFMFGDDFLVAPVYDRTTQRAVYLPKGEWIDYWTGEQFEGPQTMVVDAPLDKLPLYVKPGAVIPELPDGVETLVPRNDEMDPDIETVGDARVIEVWPGSRGSMHTWEGVSAEYQVANGKYQLHVQTKQKRSLKIRLRYMQPGSIEGVAADISYDQSTETTIIDLGQVEGAVDLSWQ